MDDKDIAIKVENLSKIYRIGAKERIHDSFGRAIFEIIKSPLKNYRKYRSLYKFDINELESEPGSRLSSSHVLWALRDVSFEVKRGESIGIIGRNGAGKSTLLKILSRITGPTLGRGEIIGRVSSLLEVGTGFHQELTGRENIYLNGTVLGMRKSEVKRKFEQIVEFAGVDQFIDTPVKRYSSGMKVRLAFSVAAHLEPEILIVDEVLAVGDANFQKKCLDKMENAGQQGRTVLFVSHNMEAVTRLCERAILLDEGKIIVSGPSDKVVSTYLCSDLGTTAAREWRDPEKAPSGPVARLISVRAIGGGGQIKETMDIREPIILEMRYEVLQPGMILLPHFRLGNEKSDCIFVTLDKDPDWSKRPRPKGIYTSRAVIPGNLLAEGMVIVNCNLMTLDPDMLQFSAKSAVSFNVIDSLDGDSARGDYAKRIPGMVRPLLKWETEYLAN